MFKAIKHSHGFAAVLVAAVSCAMVAPASASELYDITVVPAEDDRAPIPAFTIEPAAYNSDVDTSSKRVQPMRSAERKAPIRIQSATGPKRTLIAWPYTARTLNRK